MGLLVLKLSKSKVNQRLVTLYKRNHVLCGFSVWVFLIHLLTKFMLLCAAVVCHFIVVMCSLYEYTTFVHSTADGHSSCLQFGARRKSAAMGLPWWCSG